jgi:uracil DNA glycosylase
MQINPKMENSWLKHLKNEFKKPYFEDIKQKITDDIKS